MDILRKLRRYFLGKDALQPSNRSYQIKIPTWFVEAGKPNKEALEWWDRQVLLSNNNNEFEEPKETLRHNIFHQQFSISFFEEIPKDFVSVLDVGCNDGWMCKQFKENGKKPVGINNFLYPTDYKFIIDNNLDIRIMDMHDLDFDDGSFDAIWLRHSLEHSLAPLVVLSECHRVLKEGGYLFVALPPYPIPPLYYPGHYNIIPPFQLEYFLKIYRFDILSLYEHGKWEKVGDDLETRCIAKKTNLPPAEPPLPNQTSNLGT